MKKVAAEIAKRKIGCAVVVDKRKPVGIVSESDIVRFIAKKRLTNSTLVKAAMSSPVCSITQGTPLDSAAKLARDKGFRHFPVVNNRGELVGVMTKSDIMSAVEESTRSYVRDLEARMERTSRRMARLIMTDELTGIYNRRYLKGRLKEEFDRAKRYSFSISCLMIDIDHFKGINDEYGHPAGDVVLKRLAKLLVRALRRGDVCARIGGEEFFVLMPHTMLSGAFIVASRLRAAVEEAVFRYGHKQMHITLSIGICNMPAHGPESANDFLRMADDALYAAKRKGRNRVETYEPSRSQSKPVEVS